MGSADILSGNSRLICLLCAQIFDKFKGMRPKITADEVAQVQALYGDDDGDLGGSAAMTSGAQSIVVTPPLPSDGGDGGPHFADSKSSGMNKYKEGDWDTKSGKPKKHKFIHISSSSTSKSGKSADFSEATMAEIVQVF